MRVELIDEAVTRLREHGATFALLHGSQVRGTATQSSDIDVAAYFAGSPPASFEVDLPPGIDLLVLNNAPLELRGRIALEGELILDDDPPTRVTWIAQTRKIYADEKYRIDRSHAEFLEAVRSGRSPRRVVRLLRAASDNLQSLAREQEADATRRADPLWLPGIKYLMVAAIECCIDVAQHACSSEQWGPPRDNGDAMRILGERGVITADTAVAMRQATGFRNVLVHEYVEVDDDIVVARLADLSDLQGFVRQVSDWL